MTGLPSATFCARAVDAAVSRHEAASTARVAADLNDCISVSPVIQGSTINGAALPSPFRRDVTDNNSVPAKSKRFVNLIGGVSGGIARGGHDVGKLPFNAP